MTMDRRTVLKSGSAAALLGGPFAGFAAMPAQAQEKARALSDATLVPIPDERDGVVRLHLPEGFKYRSFHDTSQEVVLDDGTKLPGRHDGMGAFRGDNGSVLLVRNHEVNNPVGAFGPLKPYDASAGGGTTTIRVTKHGEVLGAWTSLNGTMMNCSGGIMPWGSWITCEETVNGPDVGPDFTGAPNTSLEKPHGYIFEVPVDGNASGKPITRAGRFAHEAVSFDAVGGALYLTEDNFAFASGFYRYTPKHNPMKTGRLDDEGVLEMLAIKGRPNLHLEGAQQQGVTYDVEWVAIDEPDPKFQYKRGEEAPTTNDEAIVYVGNQGRAKGAAYFSRLEGQVYDDGVVYFTSTQGGGAAEDGTHDPSGYGNGFGQVWGYDTRNQTLTCVYQSPDKETLDFPDNVTVSKDGTLVLCEDSSGDNYLRGLTPDGKLWDIGLNRMEGRYGDEFAGSTFSTDGHTLFVNIQASRGLTFAIWGPWSSIGV
ncbi:MAG TPA: alkaline phosphatase PhoX [Nocardioidaceae bacterium]|nr:alkaline phosphatase PhoX [Nocardioidaceae bacterium]